MYQEFEWQVGYAVTVTSRSSPELALRTDVGYQTRLTQHNDLTETRWNDGKAGRK